MDHYRKFLEFLDREQKTEGWSERTKQNRQRIVHTFLKNLEADRGLWFPFIRNKKYRIEVPQIEQTKYRMEQVKLALQHATVRQRLALMLGPTVRAFTEIVPPSMIAKLPPTTSSYIPANHPPRTT